MTRPAHALIDMSALRNNVQRVRACATQQRIIAVIKANAYGHGAVRVAKAIEMLVDAFAVSCLEEALELRESGIKLPILLLEGVFQPEELPAVVEHGLHMVIHTPMQVEWLLAAQLSQPVSVWLKLDTGMHRLGFSVPEVATAWKRLTESSQVTTPVRLMSHLSCADDRQDTRTEQQTQRFLTITKGIETELSLANSAGILAWPQTHVHWVRPGIMLYGVSPFMDSVAKEEGLQAVMQLHSVLISVRTYRQGDAIGYGATWKCPQAMPVGVVAIGYADGYPRHAPNGTPVLVNGRRVPLIGRVSMDMVTVDLRTQPNAKVGDPVVLWGKNLPVEEIATHAGTIGYELLCAVSQRVKRIERQ